ncbi:hypothetical protein U9M48_028845 [Paspalum notatum var. saurae]|uniref:Uncharacterized protein n=1 Tax=Paspalum notatum var. saurae TaxID=547442 RepID=A0AAQ3X1F9_PASNO
MQSAVDALAEKLELSLQDCALLVRTGILSTPPSARRPRRTSGSCSRGYRSGRPRLLEALRKDEKSVLAVLGRANVSAMVVWEKAAAVVC